MTLFATILMIAAMAITVLILFTGVVSMAKGGEFNRKWSNRLMRYRIVAQAVALAMFALAIFLIKNGG